MSLPWMSLRDRHRWRSARTIADAGTLMALWLEGEIASRPGYQPRSGPDEETELLVPTLAAACRAGYVTTCSQPGWSGRGYDGEHWEQRAAVEGLVADPTLAGRLTTTARAAGLIAVTRTMDSRGPARPVPVTTRAGHPVTCVGVQLDHEDLRTEWAGVGPELHDAVVRATRVSIVADEYGPDGEQLWPLLADLVDSSMGVC